MQVLIAVLIAALPILIPLGMLIFLAAVSRIPEPDDIDFEDGE